MKILYRNTSCAYCMWILRFLVLACRVFIYCAKCRYMNNRRYFMRILKALRMAGANFIVFWMILLQPVLLK